MVTVLAASTKTSYVIARINENHHRAGDTQVIMANGFFFVQFSVWVNSMGYFEKKNINKCDIGKRATSTIRRKDCNEMQTATKTEYITQRIDHSFYFFYIFIRNKLWKHCTFFLGDILIFTNYTLLWMIHTTPVAPY